MARRATVSIRDGCVVKTYRDPEGAQREADWYRRLPWAAPQLLDHQPGVLVIEYRPTAQACPTWRPVAELETLLEKIHAEGVHHRDVHVQNVVCGEDDQPLLIDWETAIWHPSPLSYDLHGPEASGVAIPDIHAGLTPQWLGSAQTMSITRRWYG